MGRFLQVGLTLFVWGWFSLALGSQQRVAAALNTYLDGQHASGASNGNILIAEHGTVLVQRAVGKADAAGTRQLTLQDRFEIGSIAKEFDAVGLLMLQQQGKLALSDPLSKFFPALPPWAATVTVDTLLHYTSGLPKPDFSKVHSDAENWAAIRAVQLLDSVPGTHYDYNNNDVFLRRRIIETASGMSFAQFVTTRELPAAGIRHAVIDPQDNTADVAHAFSDGKEDSLVAPISGWVSLTLADFQRWARCIQTFCLITPESTRLIAQTDGPDWQSGLGTAELSGNVMTRHVHDGTLMHYRALLLTRSANDRTILILCNQRDDVYDMAAAIEAMLDKAAPAR